jgi:hypothetical protein
MDSAAIRTWSQGVSEPLSPLALEHSKGSRHKQHNKELLQTIHRCIDIMQQQPRRPSTPTMDEAKSQEHSLNLDEVVEDTGTDYAMIIRYILMITVLPRTSNAQGKI